MEPDYSSINIQSFSIENFATPGGKYALVHSINSYNIVDGDYNEHYLDYSFSPPANWSQYNVAIIAMNGSSTNNIFRFWYNTDWSNRAFFDIKDDFSGPKQILISLTQPSSKIGNPSLDSITRTGIDFPSSLGNWSFGEIKFGSVKYVPIQLEVTDFSLQITPHSLAYCPITPSNIQAFLIVLICLTIVFAFNIFGITSISRYIWFEIKKTSRLKIVIFGAVSLIIFLVYSVFFGLGDHAFDMFSQKLWSYDTARYGLITLFQRPAVTSAAEFYGGVGTQNAIFAYGPFLGLYYFFIGKVYFLFSSNPRRL